MWKRRTKKIGQEKEVREYKESAQYKRGYLARHTQQSIYKRIGGGRKLSPNIQKKVLEPEKGLPNPEVNVVRHTNFLRKSESSIRQASPDRKAMMSPNVVWSVSASGDMLQMPVYNLNSPQSPQKSKFVVNGTFS